MAGQDNITYDGTCLSYTTGGDRICLHIHIPTILIVQFCYYVIYNCNGPWPGLYYSRPLAGTYPIGLMI